MTKVEVLPYSMALLDLLAHHVAERRLEVVWTSDLDSDTARSMAFLLVKNYRDVAGLVVDSEDHWPWEPMMFLHVLDKEYVVEQVVQLRGLENGGGRVV